MRHGETDWNRQGIAMGQTDIPLNQEGICQAKSARLQLKNLGIQTIYYSPLVRAQQTAEILNEVLAIPMIPIEEFKECDLGKYQGSLKEKWFHEWLSGKDVVGVESHQDFNKRVIQGLIKVLSSPSLSLIVAHGGTHSVIEKWAKVEKIRLPNCGLAFYQPLEEGKWECTIS